MAKHPTVESYRVRPEAFSDPSAEDYLGNPAVVQRLVGEFCARMEEGVSRIRGGEASAAEVTAELRAEVTRLADVFSGRDPAYKPIAGYNDVSLGPKLMADLGQFWIDRRAEWGDDPVAVLFDWLGAIVMDGVRRADGDDVLLGVMIKPTVQYAVAVLLGIERRLGE